MKLIASADINWGIGYNGKLLCRIHEDMRRFRALTIGGVVIMGRRTFLSLPGGRPLDGRVNIVLSSRGNVDVNGVVVAKSVDRLNAMLNDYPEKEAWVIGGQSIYGQLASSCTHAYITKIHHEFEADAHILNFDASNAWVQAGTAGMMVESGVVFEFVEYVQTGSQVKIK